MGLKNNSLVSISDEIYRQLKDAIIHSELRPGDRIVESRIAKENGVSQAPVREAIRRLKGETLVVTVHHQGTFVSEFSVEDVDDLYALREVLDAFALQRALRHMAETDLEHLQKLYEEIERAGFENDLPRFMKADREFHNYIYKLAKHEFLYSMWAMIYNRIEQSWYFLNRMHLHLSEVALPHKSIIEALSSRDFDAAKEANLRHLQNVRKKLRQLQ